MVSFTTIDNPTGPVAPVFTKSYFDSQGAVISNIDTATISGTVTFKAELMNRPDLVTDVAEVVLTITPDDAGAGAFGTYTFTRNELNDGSFGNVFTLILDTTTIPNGDYVFTFTYILVGGDASTAVTFSALSFNFTDGEGNTTYQISNNLISIIAVTGVGLLIIIIVMKRRR